MNVHFGAVMKMHMKSIFCMLLLGMTSHTTAKALEEWLFEQPQYVRRVHEATLVIDYFKLQRTSKHDNSTVLHDDVNLLMDMWSFDMVVFLSVLLPGERLLLTFCCLLTHPCMWSNQQHLML